MQNPQMAMAGMNAAGGPVGGAQMMNNVRPGQGEQQPPDNRVNLNTYIYDYFLKNNNHRVAQAMLDSDIKISLVNPSQKPSPNNRNINGVDAMDDSKTDMPLPKIPEYQAVDNSFLLDWWFQFWDMYSTARKKNGPPSAMQAYLSHTRQNAQLRNDAQQRLLMANQNIRYGGMMPINGVAPNDLQKRAAMNNRTPNSQQVQQLNQMNKQAMMSAQMQRDGSNMDMNGQRPQSPGSAENAPSPNKRPRVDGNNAFNGQPMGAARSQGMPQQPMGATTAGQANQMLLAGGMNPAAMPGNQFGEFGQQAPNQKSIEGMNPGVQGSPMGQQGLDGSHDLFAGNQPRAMPPGGPNAPQGNHALQDYQMQLMLLEQQNKKRLLMARQEQETIQGPHGQATVGAGFAPSMSPQGSRAGPSPNPTDQMKRGTPKLPQQGLPGSPMPDSMPQNRNSPVPNFDPNQMPPGVPPQFFPQGPVNSMMRPPSSHPGFNGQFNQQQLEQMARNGAMQNGAWRGAPPQMMPNQGQQPGPMGTPQQRAMPPPPAPPAGEQPGRTQPPSPSQQTAAPPTPSQTNKANPKGKNAKDTKKKPAKKNTATTGQTPASEQPEAPTPTPSTPITPIHPNSFNKGQNGQQPQQQPQQAPAAAPAPQVQPPTMESGGPFGNIDDGNNFDLNFGSLDGPDVLENFDFDSFLHTGDESGAFGSLGTDFNFGPDGVEAGGELA